MMESIHYFIIYFVGFVLSLIAIGWLNHTDLVIDGWSGPKEKPFSIRESFILSLVWPLVPLIISGYYIWYGFLSLLPTHLWQRFTDWYEGK